MVVRKRMSWWLLPLIILATLIPRTSNASDPEWVDTYKRCMVISGNEESCYSEIADYLATPEGRAEALRIGFRRQVAQTDDKIRANALSMAYRVGIMVKQVGKALDSSRKSQDALRSLCLSDKFEQMEKLAESADNTSKELAHAEARVLYRALAQINSVADYILPPSY